MKYLCTYRVEKVLEDMKTDTMDKVEDFREVLDDLKNKVSLMIKDIVNVQNYLIESSTLKKLVY